MKPNLRTNETRTIRRLFAAAALAFTLLNSAPAALVSVYTLDSDLSDSLGANPNLVEFNTSSSSFTGGAWVWNATDNPGGGLVMDVTSPISTTYSIGLRMELDHFSFSIDPHYAYVKLIDFKDLRSDVGLYVKGDQLDFYHPNDESIGGTLTTETYFDIILTRDASNQVKGYLDGDSTPVFSFTDTNRDALPRLSRGNYRFRLFHDDVVTPTGRNDEWSTGSVQEIRLWDHTLEAAEVPAAFVAEPSSLIQPGDADQDLDFDQLDLVQVQIAAKYLTGQPATWGQGDWNGAPGGSVGNPPPGDGLFNQRDIVAAQQAGLYLTGPYAAVLPEGQRVDGQTSIIYDANTGEVAVDAPAGIELTSINIDSAAGIFTGAPAQNLGGSFDNDADTNIFKATFGSSFGSLSFGNVARTGLSQATVLGDLTVVGSLAGGGALGNVDLIYVPEPSSAVLASVALVVSLVFARRRSY